MSWWYPALASGWCACGLPAKARGLCATHYKTAHAHNVLPPTGEERAKAVCGVCPVSDECLSDALGRGESDGIWGGLTPDERLLVGRRVS